MSHQFFNPTLEQNGAINLNPETNKSVGRYDSSLGETNHHAEYKSPIEQNWAEVSDGPYRSNEIDSHEVDYDKSLGDLPKGDFVYPDGNTSSPWWENVPVYDEPVGNQDPTNSLEQVTMQKTDDTKGNLEKGAPDTSLGEPADVNEIGKAGGRYQDLKDEGWGWNTEPPTEVHHMPADSSSNLERCDGPAIVMDYNDHRETASCGNSRDAQEYRAKQQELIEQGKFREAFQMDVDDIRSKFGNKYDEAIEKAESYINQLEKENNI